MSGRTDGFPTVTLAPIASQIAPVVGVARMLGRLLARRPATSRHAVGLVFQLMMLLAPAIQSVIGGAGIILATVPASAQAAALVDHTPTNQRDEPEGRSKPGAPGRPVAGIVVDEAGQPVAGASVRLTRDWKAPEGAVTGADGRFVIRVRSPFMLLEEELIAVSDEGRRQGMGRFRESLDASIPSAPARVALRPSRAVTVAVHDPAGKPVTDASIEVIAEYSTVARGQTDASGSLTLHYPDGAKVEWIVALKSGAGFDYFENYRSRASGGSTVVPDTVSLVLNGARTGRVKAVDSQGKPIAGVEFSTWIVKKRSKLAEANIGGDRLARVRSDRDGIATFDWLPADAERDIPLLILPGAYHAPERPSFTPEARPPDQTVRLLRNATLRGKVLRPDGRPAPGILVEAAGVGKTFSDPYIRNYGRTGADGTYSVVVTPDHAYIVAVIDRSMAAGSRNGIVLREEGETRIVPDLKLLEGTLVRGRVTYGPDRQPLAGASVGLTQQGDPLPRDFEARTGGREERHQGTETDADGRYAIRIGPGTYALYRPGGAKAETLVVDAQEEIVRDVQLESLDGVQEHHLRGQVHDLAGGKRTPVSGALLMALGTRGQDIEGRADASGRFDLSIWYDPSFLFARNPEGTRAAFLALKPGEGLALVHLGPASRATGRIADRQGKPLAGWIVWLRVEGKADSGAAVRLRNRTVTDDQGRFEFAGLVVGSRCAISAPARRGGDARGPITNLDFTVPDAAPVVLKDLVIDPDGPAVNPRVRRAPGR